MRPLYLVGKKYAYKRGYAEAIGVEVEVLQLNTRHDHDAVKVVEVSLDKEPRHQYIWYIHKDDLLTNSYVNNKEAVIFLEDGL